MLLNHFQLSVRYDVGTEILTSLQQDKETHISERIQEWCRRKRLIKADIPNEFLLEWFLKYLKLEISKDLSLFGVFTEEHAIFRAQQLEIIYSQSGVMYKIFLESPRSKINLAKPML